MGVHFESSFSELFKEMSRLLLNRLLFLWLIVHFNIFFEIVLTSFLTHFFIKNISKKNIENSRWFYGNHIQELHKWNRTYFFWNFIVFKVGSFFNFRLSLSNYGFLIIFSNSFPFSVQKYLVLLYLFKLFFVFFNSFILLLLLIF